MNKRTLMNKRTCLLTFVVAASFLLSTPATAGVLYDNGPINGNIGAWGIDYGYIVSDSFTLTGASTLTGVNLGIWVYPGDSPASLKWRITDAVPDDHILGPIGTTADLTNTPWCSGCGENFYDIYESSFSLPSVVLAPGTYYLTIDYGQTVGYDLLFWDVNNGSSVAYMNGVNVAGSIEMTSGSNSDSFQILGTGNPTTTPEPASTALFLSGLALVAGLARRKTRA